MRYFGACLRIGMIGLVGFLTVGAVHVAPFGEVSASLTDVSGSVLTVLVTNPSPQTVGVEVVVTVGLDDNSVETLSSGGIYLEPYQSVPIEVQASRTVSYIKDDPSTFPI